uniref:Uncharacterized protein n=1 Tax=Rhodopseudomonas palustris (strain BisA53) TaxID=316055 RepID=Q07TH6_RHOP5
MGWISINNCAAKSAIIRRRRDGVASKLAHDDHVSVAANRGLPKPTAKLALPLTQRRGRIDEIGSAAVWSLATDQNSSPVWRAVLTG